MTYSRCRCARSGTPDLRDPSNRRTFSVGLPAGALELAMKVRSAMRTTSDLFRRIRRDISSRARFRSSGNRIVNWSSIYSPLQCIVMRYSATCNRTRRNDAETFRFARPVRESTVNRRSRVARTQRGSEKAGQGQADGGALRGPSRQRQRTASTGDTHLGDPTVSDQVHVTVQIHVRHVVDANEAAGPFRRPTSPSFDTDVGSAPGRRIRSRSRSGWSPGRYRPTPGFAGRGPQYRRAAAG